MKNDVMHTVNYAAERSACYHPWICKLAHRSSQARSISINYKLNPPINKIYFCMCGQLVFNRAIDRMVRVSRN